MREGNACLGCIIGAAIALPIYIGLAWLLSRLARIDYWEALGITIAAGVIAAGLMLLWAIRKEKRM